MILNELFENWGGRTWVPGFGQRGFPGFGKKLFPPSLRNFIGVQVTKLDDPIVRKDLAQWFGRAFVLDRPTGAPTNVRGGFDPEAYAGAIEAGQLQHGSVIRFQMRHFYFMARVVSEEPNVQRRAFVCHFLSEIFEEYGEFFMPSRWEDHCNIPENLRFYKPEDFKKGLDHSDRSVPIDDKL